MIGEGFFALNSAIPSSISPVKYVGSKGYELLSGARPAKVVTEIGSIVIDIGFFNVFSTKENVLPALIPLGKPPVRVTRSNAGMLLVMQLSFDGSFYDSTVDSTPIFILAKHSTYRS